MGCSHLVIPDIQAKPRHTLKHLDWIGQYINDMQPDKIIQLGDLWDFPSLSSYDEGKYCMADRRVTADFDAGCEAAAILQAHIVPSTSQQYKPKWYFIEGNHEERIRRHLAQNPKLEGLLPDPVGYLNDLGWKTSTYLEPTTIDGITYCHFFPLTASGATSAFSQRNGCSSAATQLKALGSSSIAGHRQGLDQAMKIDPMTGRRIRAIIAGSCYLHNEGYIPSNFQKYWRGVLMLHNVNNGDFDLEEVSLKRLEQWYG